VKVSIFDNEILETYTYSGPDVLEKFYEYIYAEQEIICKKLEIQKNMDPLTNEQLSEYNDAKMCPNCNNLFHKKSHIKCKHHWHTTGRFLGAVCNKCNLQLRNRKRKRPAGGG